MSHLLSRSFVGIGTLALVASLHAAELPWWTSTGGGGVSQHGAVVLGGAIGPIGPQISTAANGTVTLTAGFWGSLPGQPKPAQPSLSILLVKAGTAVQISWPLTAAGFLLEFTNDLESGIWQVELAPVVDTVTEHTVTVPLATDQRSYRLRGQ